MSFTMPALLISVAAAACHLCQQLYWSIGAVAHEHLCSKAVRHLSCRGHGYKSCGKFNKGEYAPPADIHLPVLLPVGIIFVRIEPWWL